MINYQSIARLLAGISDTPLIDARYFCDFYKNNPSQEVIADFINRRRQGEPVAKIIGRKGFWKRDFRVSKAVLDPRPDSETIIEAVLSFFPDKTKPYKALDVGVGSGCLILSLVDEYLNLKAVGVDKSQEALAIAQQNDIKNQVLWLCKDFYADSFKEGLDQFDIIVSNPPYIPTKEIQMLEKSVSYDPLLALDGGADGLDAYRALSEKLYPLVSREGKVFFEIGQGQENDVIEMMRLKGWSCLKTLKDLSGIIRVLVFQKS